MGTLIVDSEEHAAAKTSGDYTPEGTPAATNPEDTTPVEKETEDTSIISDVDPGDAEAGVKPVEAESKETEEETEDKEEDKQEEDDKSETAEFDNTYQEWTDEFMDSGALSDETRQQVIDTIFQKGVPAEIKEQFVKTYESGLTAIGTAATQEAFSIVGGEESYQKMIGWAQENLSAEEIVAYDADALGQDVVKRDSVIKGLHARMQQAVGSVQDFEPNLAHDGGRSQGDPIIGSRQELAKIQGTDEYKKDPAVREKVARQLRQSMATGKYLA